MKHLTKAVVVLCAAPLALFVWYEQAVYLQRVIEHHTNPSSAWGVVAWVWPGMIGFVNAVYAFLHAAHAQDVIESKNRDQ
jgi:hypothetical protein